MTNDEHLRMLTRWAKLKRVYVGGWLGLQADNPELDHVYIKVQMRKLKRLGVELWLK